MPRTLVFIRHGLTDWNRDRRFQGHEDVPLNPEGRAQAEKLGRALVREGFRTQRMITSDLSRARTTAETLAEALGYELELSPAWRERNFGRFQGLTSKQIAAKYPEDWQTMRDSWEEFQPPGGESYREFYARVQEALDGLFRPDENHLTVVSHGGCGYALLGRVVGSLRPEDPSLRLGNTSRTTFFSESPGAWSVGVLNRLDHLEEG